MRSPAAKSPRPLRIADWQGDYRCPRVHASATCHWARAARFLDGPGLLLAGDAATRLEQLVSRLSLEPGIHAVYWHTADDPSPLPVTAPAPAADAAGAGDQG
jgi:hypothetical protein